MKTEQKIALSILTILLFSYSLVFVVLSNATPETYQTTYLVKKAVTRPCGASETHPSGVCYVEMEISFYSSVDSCHYPTEDGCLTASGKIAEVGMVASNLYTFGTRLLIDGQEYVVEDRTAQRYSHRIDIWVGMGEEAHQTALANGLQYLKVKVL